MKRFLALLLVALSMMLCMTAFADSDIEIYLFGERLSCDVAPVIQDGRTLVPVRVISEEGLGADVKWDGEKRQVEITKDSLSILLTIDDAKAVVNGKAVNLDVPAVIISDRTMVPVRFVSETFKYRVEWDGEERRVSIDKEKALEIEDIEYEENRNNDAVYITLSHYAEPKIFTLQDPYRIVIDFEGATYEGGDDKYDVDSPYVKQFRYAAQDGFYRLAVECKGEQPYKVKKLNDDEMKITIGTAATAVTDEEEDIPAKDEDTTDENDKDETDPDAAEDKDGDTVKEDEDKASDDKDDEEELVLDSDMTVVIDAGHGGIDPGALGRDEEGNVIYGEDDKEKKDPLIKEKDINLSVAKHLYEYLTEEGVNAVLVRKKDVYYTLREIADRANAKEAVLFVSVHCNSVENNSSAEGVEVLYSNKEGDEKYGVASKKYAQNVLDEILDRVDTVDRGIKERPGLAVLKWTDMPAVLVEMGFITNPTDQERLLNRTWQKAMAKAIGDGVIKTLDEMTD